METKHKIERGNGCEICQMWLDSKEKWNLQAEDLLKSGEIKLLPETYQRRFPNIPKEYIRALPKPDLEYHVTRKHSFTTELKTKEEVFAANIQVSQLKTAIPEYEWSDERFQKEREYFLWWLLKMKDEKGFNFTDQVSAWDEYKRMHEYVEIDDTEEFTPSWMEEIENELRRQVYALKGRNVDMDNLYYERIHGG